MKDSYMGHIMEFNIYKVEKCEIKLDIINNIKENLYNILLHNVGANSKTYSELELLIDSLSEEESECEKYIKESFFDTKNNMSQLKIETHILKNIFLIKKENVCTSISDTVKLLIDNYNHDILYANLSSITMWKMPKSLEKNLINTKFNICISEDSEHKIVYGTDDLVIEKNLEYLDLRKFKLHNKDESEYYFFSPNLTLADLDDFFEILSVLEQ